MLAITPPPIHAEAMPAQPLNVTQDLSSIGSEGTDPSVEINLFALLRVLATLLQKLCSMGYEQKAKQSLYQLQLSLSSAETIRDSGSQKRWMSFCKLAGSATFFTCSHFAPHNIPQEGRLALGKILASTVEDLSSLSLSLQSKITENDAFSKEADAYVQSTHATVDGLSKQIDQLSQMLREIMVQSVKEVHHSHHQALASVMRV